MPAQTHSTIRSNVTGMDIPQLNARIATAVTASESHSRSYHTVILTNDTDSVRACVTNALKAKFEDKVELLVLEHPKNTLTNAYRGVKLALTNFFNALNGSYKPEVHLQFLKSLKRELGSGFPLFASFVPESTGKSPITYDAVLKDLLYIESELFPILKSFFIFLADYSGSRVFFLVNDLHNVDGPSLSLFRYLLRELPPDKGIWFGIGNEGQPGIDNVNLLVDDRGEALLLARMETSLARTEIEQLLLNNFGRAPSEWVDECIEKGFNNEEAIRDAFISFRQNGVGQPNGLSGIEIDFHKTQWANLSKRCRQLLTTITCSGYFDPKLCARCLDTDEPEILKLLEEAAQHDFALISENRTAVPDDRFRKLILGLATSQEKQLAHYTVAITLAHHIRSGDSHLNEVVVEHFNEAMDLVRKNNQQVLCAELNFKVAQMREQKDEVNEAREFYTIAVDLLRECPWNHVDQLLFQISFALARLEYRSGEYDPAEHHVDYLLDRVEEVEKRASLYELKLVINNRLGRYRKAVLILKEGLMELGLDMPWKESDVTSHVDELARGLPHGVDELSSETPSPEARHKRAILKLLFVGGMSLHHTSDGLMTWGALQIIRHAGKGAGSGEKAIGYVVFGRVQMMQNEIDRGYDFGQKALLINRSLNDLALRCRVYGIFAFFIQPWKRPFDESFELLAEAGNAGEKTGDLIGAYVIKTHQLNLLLLAGKPLEKILDIGLDESNPSSELTYYITHYQKNLVRFLRNESTVFSIPHLEPSWLAASNTIQEEKFYRNFVWSRYYFLFGYYELAEDAAAEANKNRKLQEGSPLIPANYLIWSLSITQNWWNISTEVRRERLLFLRDVSERFSVWAEHSPENFGACNLLLKAEILRIENNHESALEKYRHAIEACGDNLWYKAVAMELTAKFQFSLGNVKGGGTMITESINWYIRWGAVAKATQLRQQYSAYVGSNTEQDGFNIELIQHELGGYLQVGPVIKKLLALCLRISGSFFGVLASREGGGEAEVLGRYSLFAPPDELEYFANQKIQESLRKGDAIEGHCNRSEGSHDSGNEPRQATSFLVVPVFLRDHLSFALYLESCFTGQTYPREIVRWIRVALNQGAITLENARVHELSLKLNDEIRLKMEEKERLMKELETQRDIHLKAVERTQNEDRKRIAGNLHDSVGAMLSSIKMRLNSLQSDFQNHIPDKADKFAATVGLIDETVQELRRIVYDMMPLSLHRFGLPPALNAFVDQINESQRVQVELQILGLDERLIEELEMAIYRICQELVQNVLKHAAATKLRIQIIRHLDRVNLIVEDNGIGMTTSSLVPGIGFDTITAKVDLYRGTFTIESSPGKGTMILIDIPLMSDTHE